MNNLSYTWLVTTLYMAFMAFVISIINNSGNGFNDMQIFIFLNISFAGIFYLAWTLKGSYKPVDVGTRICHETYGLGTVIDINSEGNICIEYDVQHSELACRFDKVSCKTTRKNCLDWYLGEDLSEIHIIKKAAC